MKKILVILAVSWSLGLNAQYCARDYYDDAFQQFLGAQTTYVQKTDNDVLDSLLEQALTLYWKVNKFKLISPKRLSEVESNPGAAILLPLTLDVTRDGMTVGNYGMYCLIMGGKRKSLSMSDIIAFAQTDYKYLTPTNYSFMYSFGGAALDQNKGKIPGFQFRMLDIIKGINDALEYVKTNKSKFRAGLMHGMEYMNENFYNKSIKILKKKTLYVYYDNVEDREKVKKVYPYKIEFVGREDFYDVVAGKKENAVYMVLTTGYSTDVLILTDPSTHKCVGGLPFGYVTTIDAGDFKDLVKTIEKADK